MFGAAPLGKIRVQESLRVLGEYSILDMFSSKYADGDFEGAEVLFSSI